MASSGNFCTMNPLHRTSGNVSYSNGNLTYSPSSSWTTTTWTRGNFVIPKDKKIYMELYHKTQSGYYASYGFATNLSIPTAEVDGNGFVGVYNGAKKVNGTGTNSYMTVPVQGDIVQLAIDGSNNKVWIGLNNTWQGSGDPANGSNETGTINTSNALGYDVTFASTQNSISVLTANFGQDDTFGGVITAAGNADGNGKGVFKYAPPTGFLAMCSSNLSVSDDIDPAQTDDDYPGKNFGVVTYTGNGSTQSITGLGFQPDLVWLKSRSNTKANALFDSNRGVTKYFSSDSTGAETTDTSTLTAFGSDGFSLASPAANNLVNGNGFTYVGWAWRANAGTTASNSDGASTTTVQANTKAGFSIIETPNYSSNSTFGHGLSSAPEFFTVKLTGGSQWATYHKGLTSAGYYVALNSSNAQASGSFFNSTAPTSSVFSLGASFGGSGAGICYAWHSVEGYSKFGTYVGNANADGPFIYTGFRPSMLFLKNATASNGWFTFDKLRDGFNDQNDTLSWQDTTVEDNTYKIDILSNGFKIRGSNNAHNQSGQTFIYGAWADVPFKYNNAR